MEASTFNHFEGRTFYTPLPLQVPELGMARRMLLFHLNF